MNPVDGHADDRIARYVAASRPPFEALRAIASQLAGFVLLNTVVPRDYALQDVPLHLAASALDEAVERLRTLMPPAQAAHHHHHLLSAAASLHQALDLGRHHLVAVRQPGMAAACEVPLREGITHLRHAGTALPGFHLVTLDHACCALHAEGTGL